jgi:hypothetical protein
MLLPLYRLVIRDCCDLRDIRESTCGPVLASWQAYISAGSAWVRAGQGVFGCCDRLQSIQPEVQMHS